jgi:hypothetical protein
MTANDAQAQRSPRPHHRLRRLGCPGSANREQEDAPVTYATYSARPAVAPPSATAAGSLSVPTRRSQIRPLRSERS